MRRRKHTLSRKDCLRTVFPLPPLGRRDLMAWIREELTKLYPGSLEDIRWDYRIGEGELILYLTEKSVLADLRGNSRKKLSLSFEGEHYPIFRDEDRISPFARGIAYGLFTLLFLSLTVIMPLIKNKELENQASALKARIGEEKVKSARILERNSYYSELNRKLALLEESSPPDLYNRIAGFIPFFASDGIITSMTIEGNHFQGHGVADNPLLLVEEMRSSGAYLNLRFEESIVDLDSGKDRYLWRGEFDD